MSLRLRLSLVFALGTAALIALSALLFLAQLQSSVNAALDATLQTRSEALAALLRTGSLPTAPADSGQFSQQTGNFAGADEVAQILSPRGTVIYPPGTENPGPLLSDAQLRQAARGRITTTTSAEGEQVRILARAVHRGAGTVIAVVGVTTDVATAAQARARMFIQVGGPPTVLAAGLGAWLLTGAALGPVHRMRRRLDEITEHDSDARLQVPGTKDEIASLATTTNRLLDRLHLALSRQRGFVADAGHELRTPLTALKAELDLASRPGKSQGALAAAVVNAASDTDRLIRLAEDLLLLARADDGSAFLAPQRIDVSAHLLASARSFAAQADARGITISVHAQPGLTVVADPGRLRQALDNLIDNAIRHSPDGGMVEATSRSQVMTGSTGRFSRRRVVAIEIRDHGPGFSPEFLPQAFERFRRADLARDRADGGAGLGLAIVASITHAHGGRAVAENHPAGGARVRIELPVITDRG